MWNGEVKVITGIRRCGKSVLLFDLFYDYLTSRYPDLRTTAVRNWQTAIKQVNERIRSNDDECQDEIEEISKELKEFA